LHFNQRVERWKQDDKYFFHTEISEQTGAWIVSGGKRMLMLGSYSYLGLIGHPVIAEATCQAILNYGSGPHGVRILTGTTCLHRELEENLAEFMGAEDSVVYSSGFMCNLSTISSLVGEGDCVIGDEWNHASIVDGCKFSGAAFLQFKHNDMESLERRLIEAAGRHTLVVVDSVFSMDGDLINLPAVVKLCRRYGALLMVDEAHSLGVLGKTGRGIIEHFGMEPDSIDIKMGTLSKAIPSIGGFVAASREIVRFLKHQARGFIFSGAVPAPMVAASLAALNVIRQEPDRIARLWEMTRQYNAGLKSIGFDTYRTQTPIAPIACRTEEMALEMTKICRDEGLFVIPVFYPAVPMNSPRLRTCVSAAHTEQDIEFALDVLAYAGRKTGLAV
jgi:glycine C-acetyltransferase